MPIKIIKTAYTAEEMKQLFPETFVEILKEHSESQDEILWQDDIIKSLKAIIEQAGITLFGYEIGAYSASYIKLDFTNLCENNDANEIYFSAQWTGKDAMGWLKKTLLKGLTFKRISYVSEGKRKFRYDYFKKGVSADLDITGFSSDYDFMHHLITSIKDGNTIAQAFRGLSTVAEDLLENELEFQKSEAYFMAEAISNNYLYESNGERIYK